MALGDENAEDEKEEKPKVYKSAVDSEDAAASTSRNSHRPAALAGVGEQDDVKLEKNDLCLEADVQTCPSTSGSTNTAGTSSGGGGGDGHTKHSSKDASSSSTSTGASTTAVNGASPKSGHGKSSGVSTANGANTCAEASRSTAFTRTHPNRINGLDAFMNGLSSAANVNYYGMPPQFYLGAAGPSPGGSSTSTHGVIHPMASYPHTLPVYLQAAAATAHAHLMGNRFPGSPNSGSSPFSFQQGGPFAGFSPSYPTGGDGGQTAPSQAASQAAFPFAFCGDPKTVGIRSPFGFTGQCSPSFGFPMIIQPAFEQWYAAQRYNSPIYPLMMTAAAAAASAPVPCSPTATLSPIVNNSPIAGGAPSLTPSMLAPPALIPAFPGSPYANNLRFSSPAVSTATNALAAMSQIPLPIVTTSVKSVANNMVANAGSSSSSSRSSLTQNGSTSSNVNAIPVARNRMSTTNLNMERHHRHENENGTSSKSTNNSISATAHHTSSSRSHEKALKKMTHIKKPLNAFMLYMKEMRPAVMQEVGLKERQSAEINRILGRRWHSLTRDEQQKYYDMARHERTLHMQRYPNWSARDNYALHKKKKRKRDKAQENLEMKKCRARFGLDQQSKWCKHCKRKKKCLWFRDGAATGASTASSSGVQENGTDSAEQSPPCAQVTSTTNGPDTMAFSATVLAAETDVNSPQSLVTSTITIAPGGRPALPFTNGGTGLNKKKASVSTAAGAAAVPKNGTNNKAPPRKKRRRTTDVVGGDCTDDEDGEATSSASEDEFGSTDEEEFEDEEEIDEEAEAAAAARAAVEGADFDEDMAALISPPSSDHNHGLVEDGHTSTVT